MIIVFAFYQVDCFNLKISTRTINRYCLLTPKVRKNQFWLTIYIPHLTVREVFPQTAIRHHSRRAFAGQSRAKLYICFQSLNIGLISAIKISVVYGCKSLFGMGESGINSLVCASPGSKTVRTIHEIRFIYGLDDYRAGHLNNVSFITGIPNWRCLLFSLRM